MMGIKTFYRGQNIFITGGTGFMGKVLIEKLLRSCPDIKNIYVLIRHRKGYDITTRVNDMLNLPLFEKIKTENPGVAENKIIPVKGDLSKIRLGLSDDDYNMLTENVSIVFHVAATVRFDDPIHDAIIKNVRGTREVVQLAKQMKNILVFLHVSTTYCNCNRVFVEEKVYESPISWQDAILISENLDPKLSQTCSKKFLGSFPNTYTFTKLLAENIIDEEVKKKDNKMKMVIFRPSIVISTIKEPIVGWIDNVNGPVGLMTACGKGISLVTYADKNITPDFMAVDVSIKAIIVAAYHSGTHNSSMDSKLSVYNGSSLKKSVSNSMLMEFAVKYFLLYPFDEVLWRPRIRVTNSKFIYTSLTIIQQVLPALLISFVMKVIGKSLSVDLVTLQQKIYLATIALSTFTLQTWVFTNENFLGLLKHIPDSEKEDFDFNFENINAEETFKNVVIGCQKYLLNTNSKKTMNAKKKMQKLIWMDRILRTLFFALLAWCFLKLILVLFFNI